jgi:hypothetical protein
VEFFAQEREPEFFEIKGLFDEHFKKLNHPIAFIWVSL